MALNLVRNSRVFFTTNVDANTGVIALADFDTSDTFEIQVLDGFSFSQNTTTETITLNEAGETPSRGQRAFNTALEPVEFTFSTYIRPKKSSSVTVCEESVLWNAFATGRGATDAWSSSANPATLTFANSNKHQLKNFGMIMLVDNVAYLIDNCALDQATIDFGLDAIATIAWTGRGTTIRQLTGATVSADGTLGGGLTGTVKTKDTAAGYLANKLSTVNMVKGINGAVTSSSYNVPITGGSITFANNITYLTPALLGTVNTPVTYFTGTRAITGSLTAYLRTGGADTGAILADLLDSSDTEIAPAYKITISIGGASNGNRVQISIPAAMLSIPTVSAEQVVTTTMNFTAHGFTDGTTDTYNIEAANEASISYYSA